MKKQKKKSMLSAGLQVKLLRDLLCSLLGSKHYIQMEPIKVLMSIALSSVYLPFSGSLFLLVYIVSVVCGGVMLRALQS
jgi:hypothetical protein